MPFPLPSLYETLCEHSGHYETLPTLFGIYHNWNWILFFSFKSVGENSDVLTKALHRYKDLTFPDPKVPADKRMKQALRLEVKVLLPYQPMSLKMDEDCKCCDWFLGIPIFGEIDSVNGCERFSIIDTPFYQSFGSILLFLNGTGDLNIEWAPISQDKIE